MITREEAATYFRNLIGSKASWLNLKESQFVGHLSVFVSWCLREALWRLERIEQEFFISTALNDASIRAHAEDREYIPRKRKPATGTVTVVNTGEAALSFPALLDLSSNDGTPYLTTDVVETLQPGESVVIGCQQSELQTITHTVTTEEPFYQFTLDSDISAQLASFSVLVQESAADNFELWSLARLFQNSYPDSKVFDEFYTHQGKTGIRFGNGLFGAIPQQGAEIKIEVVLTNGSTTLMPETQLSQVVTDYPCTITVHETIWNGGEAESIKEMKNNLHYWATYNEKLIWDDDYTFFMKRHISGIVWCKAWGEAEEEAQSGFKLHNINRIFLTGYAPDNTALDGQVLGLLSNVHLLNRKFTWVTPIFTPYSLIITGKVTRTTNITTAEQAIRNALAADYSKDSPTRIDTVFVKDFYRIIESTGYFSGTNARFEVVVNGSVVPTQLQEMVYLDMSTTAINLTYA